MWERHGTFLQECHVWGPPTSEHCQLEIHTKTTRQHSLPESLLRVRFVAGRLFQTKEFTSGSKWESHNKAVSIRIVCLNAISSRTFGNVSGVELTCTVTRTTLTNCRIILKGNLRFAFHFCHGFMKWNLSLRLHRSSSGVSKRAKLDDSRRVPATWFSMSVNQWTEWDCTGQQGKSRFSPETTPKQKSKLIGVEWILRAKFLSVHSPSLTCLKSVINSTIDLKVQFTTSNKKATPRNPAVRPKIGRQETCRFWSNSEGRREGAWQYLWVMSVGPHQVIQINLEEEGLAASCLSREWCGWDLTW